MMSLELFLEFFVLAFLAQQVLVLLCNVLFMDKLRKIGEDTELVSIVVPVRNEAANLPALLQNLTAQTHPQLEFVFYDDESTDGSSELLADFAKENHNLRVFHSKGLKKGWRGKNFACYQAASHCKGAYLLFMDADVRLAPQVISQSLNFVKKKKVKLLSIFPQQICDSLGERSVVPLMNQILFSLLPLVLVRKTRVRSLSAANGQFMFFEKACYDQLQPHEIHKHETVEDIRIAQYYKRQRLRIACTYSQGVYCKMYHGYRQAIRGFSKNIVMFFKNSYLFALLYAASTFGLLLYLVAIASPYAWHAWGLVLLKIILTNYITQANWLHTILLYPLQQINLLVLYISSLNPNKTWKGRPI